MHAKIILIVLLAAMPGLVGAQVEAPDSVPTPAPVSEVRAEDTPNDAGRTIDVEWPLSPDEEIEGGVTGYEILRATSPAGPYEPVATVDPGTGCYTDSVANGVCYYYQVRTSSETASSLSPASEPVIASAQWFNRDRTNMLIFLVVLSFAVLYFIQRAKAGAKLYIRRIGGLDAVEEGIGRATEMGKPVLYVPGILEMDNIQTIASMVILGRVARRVAEYETRILVPSKMPVAYNMSQEVVKQAFNEAGRPDAYRPDDIPFITMDQFGYAAAVDGIMLREKAGTIFLLGGFYAEALILAETGHSVGAIQIAGTAQPAQLPFFIAACDYTLIGEELFAASAYLSEEPRLLGSLKGQDWGKIIAMGLIVVGIVLETLGYHQLTTWMITK